MSEKSAWNSRYLWVSGGIFNQGVIHGVLPDAVNQIKNGNRCLDGFVLEVIYSCLLSFLFQLHEKVMSWNFPKSNTPRKLFSNIKIVQTYGLQKLHQL